jgi:hypothetical protein
VTTVRTSSISGMTGAGLKKWNPSTLFERLVRTARSITGSEEVFVAMMACGLADLDRAQRRSPA